MGQGWDDGAGEGEGGVEAGLAAGGIAFDEDGGNGGAANAAVTAQPVSAKDTDSSETPKLTGARVAWADVKSFPVGAEIFVDDKSTGQSTPARVQVSSGVHVFTLHLEGFRDVRRGVDVSDGGTVEVRGLLRRTKPQ